MMKRLLVATDLSPRSAYAVQRALQLAQSHGADVVILHVVDEDQPTAIVASEIKQVEDYGRRTWEREFAKHAVPLDIRVVAGIAYREIIEVAAKARADLIVVGTPRRDILRQVFTGTTAERVMRLGRIPVLMVRRSARRPYESIFAAVDFSEYSENALDHAQRLGLLDDAMFTIVHAFVPMAEGLMRYANVEPARIREHVETNKQEAEERIKRFLHRPRLRKIAARTKIASVAAKGYPFEVIERAVQRRGADLVVIGTHGAGAVRRLLFGSVAEEALRKLSCDVLAVPNKAN